MKPLARPGLMLLFALMLAGCGSAAIPSTSAGPRSTVESIPSASPKGSATASSGPGACPASPTVTILGGWTADVPSNRLPDCYGRRDLAVNGYLGSGSGLGIGGVNNGIVPQWLGEWAGLPVVLLQEPVPASGCLAPVHCVWMFVFAPPDRVLPLVPERWVEVTGHFGDPVATTCRWVRPATRSPTRWLSPPVASTS